MSGHRTSLAAVAAVFVLPGLAMGQSAAPDFGVATVEVVSELRGQDRGDGSGNYALSTTLTDGSTGVTLRHELMTERTVEGETVSNESLVVLEGDKERYRAESDPGPLGPYAIHATTWAIPFDVEFHPDPRKNYRAQQKKVAEVVHTVVADAKVSTKSGSDGRTSATVEVPGSHPADTLARQFVGIREALREADLGLAKLVIRGTAIPPAGAVTGSP